MVQCNECSRWVHALCEGIDQSQYEAMSIGTHPVWGTEYLCPICRVQISQKVIAEIRLNDHICMFACPVTEAEAQNYFDVIRNPMDLQSMGVKAERGQYKSLQSVRQDFELMCLNAIEFNQDGDEYWVEARAFYDKGKALFEALPRRTHSSGIMFTIYRSSLY